ncbi:MAG: hypothetical protein F4144_11965 [Acidimicrobiaceae bacterium]|nr:hypothetical protein [Acidimicrobiaceae bacterium]MYK77878.1 hypothetical protein [Acidimicrobiaceae bacterium]
MTATTAEPTQMAHTSDSRPDPAAAVEEASAGSWVRRWAVLGDNSLQTLMTTVAVALLIFVLTDNRSRVDRLEDAMNARFTEQDARIDGLDRRLTARIDGLDAKIDEINLKLTALIAALNMTGEVEAAVEGRLLGSEPPEDGPGGTPG